MTEVAFGLMVACRHEWVVVVYGKGKVLEFDIDGGMWVRKLCDVFVVGMGGE